MRWLVDQVLGEIRFTVGAQRVSTGRCKNVTPGAGREKITTQILDGNLMYLPRSGTIAGTLVYGKGYVGVCVMGEKVELANN